jgi:hypothetical protein
MLNIRRPGITDKEIEAFRFVHHRKHLKHWESLYEHYKNSNDISEIQLSVLEKLANDRFPMLSSTQSLVIYRLYQDAVKNGWSPNEK